MEVDKMKQIKYMREPNGFLCGQTCVAMLAGVTVENVISIMQNDIGCGVGEIKRALDHYGIRHAKTMTKADNTVDLPKACSLKVLLPGYGHWILYYDGRFYDPEFGETDVLYRKARIQSYLEVFMD